MQVLDNVEYKTAAVLFGGIGGESAGLMKSQVEYGGKVYRFKLLCSIDNDPVACRNHDIITGSNTARVMDLFTREQYVAWHGSEPPDDWQEVTAWDMWVAFDYQVPFFLFTSPPCKGLSGLLPEKSAKTQKYQALNQLTVRGLELALQACIEYGGGVPAVIQLENVPRIKSRGKSLLKQIEKTLKKYGYAVSMRADHNLGEIGGLGQNRVRFLIMARHEAQIPNAIYYPEKKRLKAIGDVIGPLPLPGDIEAGGPLHKLPQLQWKTWVRLALIKAGGDWRDLQDVPYEQYRIVHQPRGGAFAVEHWDEVSRTVTGTAGPGRSNGAAAVSDPRVGFKEGTHGTIYKVCRSNEPSPTVTGAHRPNNGAMCITDPRLSERAGRHPGVYQVVRMDDASPCVTGTRFGSAALVADTRLGCSPRAGTYGVQGWNETGKTVTGAGDVHSGTAAIADPRIPEDTDRGTWILVAEDGTWHRPMTTFELAMLQSFPQYLPDGRPFQLEGCSDAKAREYIGNAVPRDSAEHMGNVILFAGAQAEAGLAFEMSWDSVWVTPEQDYYSVVIH